MTVPSFPSLLGLAYPVARAPTWRTIKQDAVSGKRTRLQLWTYPLYKYEIPIEYLGSNAADLPGYPQNTDWQTLSGFFNSVAGAALPFHWNDPYDNAASNQLLGTGDGTTTRFNFIRTLGGFIEPIQDVATVSAVTVNGTPTTAYTLVPDPNFGLTYALDFATAPASGASIVASFSFAWPCQFGEDSASLENFSFNFWRLSKIAFETMKVL